MKLKLILLCLIVLFIAGMFGWYCLKIPSKALNRPLDKSLVEKGVNTRVEVNRSSSVISTPNKVIEVKKPRMGVIKVDIKKNEEIDIKQPFPIQLGLIPHLGIIYKGNIEPCVGVQFIRIEPWTIGASLELCPSLLGISATKDILDNGNIGIGIGIDNQGLQRYFLVFSINL